MKFIKDLLFFELTTTGIDPDKDNIIQLSAILLDKDNLLEKNNFDSFIRVSYLDSIINEHAKLLHTDYETLRKSPKIYDVIKKFHKHFGTDFLLATNSFNNLLFLKNGFKKAVSLFDYDQHIIQLWTLGYIYTLNYGLKKMPSFHTFVDYFHLKQKKPFDALEKVRLEAEIFRKIIKEV
ncbi:MAG: exonuclease domain-containing protein [Candidatus Doudnabacteria bacterium]|nr:exonuclease domain-containing protein [Candidatus Doudnabacteria bacterium]